MRKLREFFDALDEGALGVIRVAFLAVSITAVAVYFGATDFGAVLAGLRHGDITPLVPWALGLAVETLTYIAARRLLIAWMAWKATSKGSAEWRAARSGFWINLGVLVAVLSFSCYNQLEYLGETWQPPHTALTLPPPWPFLLRAFITPALFMLAALIAPAGESLAQTISAEAKYLTRLTLEAARRQWRARLREMESKNEDVTEALVGLVDDPVERHAIDTIHQALWPGRVRIQPGTSDLRRYPALESGHIGASGPSNSPQVFPALIAQEPPGDADGATYEASADMEEEEEEQGIHMLPKPVVAAEGVSTHTTTATTMRGRTLGAPTDREAASGPVKHPSEYTADDPAFDCYVLPEGIKRTTLLPMSVMAQQLGVPPSTLWTVWTAWLTEYDPARGDQVNNAMNIPAYQVLALVECGLLRLPKHVRVVQEVAI